MIRDPNTIVPQTCDHSRSFLFFYSLIALAVLCPLLSLSQDVQMKMQFGHSNSVVKARLSPDGHLLASLGANEKIVQLWHLRSGRLLRSFAGSERQLDAFDYSADGKYIAATGLDATLRIFDVNSGKQLHQTKINGFATLLVYRPDGKYLLGAWGTRIYVWDGATGALIREFDGISPIKVAAFSADGKKLITGGSGGALEVYDFESTRHLATLKGHKIQIISIESRPQSDLIATGDEYGEVRVWNLAEYKEVKTKIPFEKKGIVAGVCFSHDGKLMATSEANSIRIFETTGWTMTKQIFGFGNVRDIGFSQTILFSQDDKQLLYGNARSIYILDHRTGTVIRELKGEATNLNNVALSPDGKFIAAGVQNLLKIWDVAKAKPIHSIYSGFETSGLAFSPDGKWLAYARASSVDLLSVPDFAKIRELRCDGQAGYAFGKNAFVFSPDGRFLAMGGFNDNIVIWDLNSDKQPLMYSPVKSSISALAFSADNNSLFVGYDPTEDNIPSFVELSVANGKILRHLPTESVYGIKFYNSTNFITAENGSLRTWSTGQHNFIQEMKADKFFTAWDVSVHPGINRIASGNLDGTINVWEMSSLKLITTFVGVDMGYIRSVDYSADGKFLIASMQDGQIKVYDAASNKQIVTLLASAANDLNFLALAPDGYYYTSKNGITELIHFVKDQSVYGFDQFDLKFNRPDIILSRIGKAEPGIIASFRKAFEKRVRKLGFTEQQVTGEITGNVPDVSLPLMESSFIKSNVAKYKFDVTGADKIFPIDRFNVYVNNVAVYGSGGLSVRDKNSKNLTMPIEVDLSVGRNKIDVSVLNQQGIESLKESFEVMYEAPELKPALFVLAIGVSDFIGDEFDLTYAAKDADDLSMLLKTNAGGFSRVEAVSLTNGECTKEKIVQAGSFFKISKPDDVVVVFVASHGLLDNNLDYYIATADIDFNNPAARGLSYEALERLLDGIPSRKKLLLIDACHSGEVDKEDVALADNTQAADSEVKSRGFKKVVRKNQGVGLDNSFDLMNELFADIRRGTGAVVISSASGTEFAFESSEWKNGVFTYSIMEGLRTWKADLDQKGQISVSELKEYVVQKVTTLTNGKQHPTSRKENLEFDFTIW